MGGKARELDNGLMESVGEQTDVTIECIYAVMSLMNDMITDEMREEKQDED